MIKNCVTWNRLNSCLCHPLCFIPCTYFLVDIENSDRVFKSVRPNEPDQLDPTQPKFGLLGPNPTQLEFESWGPSPTKNQVQIGFIWVFLVHCRVESKFEAYLRPTRPVWGFYGVDFVKFCGLLRI